MSKGLYDSEGWSLGPVNCESVFPEDEVLQGTNAEPTFTSAFGSSEGVFGCLDDFALKFQHSMLAGVQPAQTLLQNKHIPSTVLPSLEYLHPVGCELFDHIVLRPPRSFTARKVPKRQRSISRSFVICTLRSYPNMMIAGQTPPPFIHPYFCYGVNDASGCKIRSVTDYNSGRAPLKNCAAILKWNSVRDKENLVFVWRTIRCEQERLLSEVRQ